MMSGAAGLKNISYIDKDFLEFSKRILRVKTTTCNTIIYGECGHLPSSVFCHINVLFCAYIKDIACSHISQVGIYWTCGFTPTRF